ncbi:MAG: hypothetical protein IPP06_17705 [Saprospiraceae bacterium]|nr:hypothetical protein [Candidatus Vicinibacter affinis]
MKRFKIRCSAIGQIMANGKGKETLGLTTKSYVESWIKEQLYGRKKEFSNKYTTKGLTVEQDAIDYVSDVLGYGFLLKNEDNLKNDFLTGTPDIILNNLIIDIKSSWDCFTFPLFEDEIKNQDYVWQGQGYMALTGAETFRVIYVLMDTPEDIIFRESSSFCWKNNIELDDEIIKDFTEKMTYKNIPHELRTKTFEFKRDEEKINSIYKMVEECREYIHKLGF